MKGVSNKELKDLDIDSNSEHCKEQKDEDDSSSSDNNLGCQPKAKNYYSIGQKNHKGSVCTPNSVYSIEFDKINMRKMSSPICDYFKSTEKFLLENDTSSLKLYDYNNSNNYIKKEVINNNFYCYNPRRLFFSESCPNKNNIGFIQYEMNNNSGYEGFLSYKDDFCLEGSNTEKDSTNRDMNYIHRDRFINNNQLEQINNDKLRGYNLNNYSVNKTEEENINNINNNQSPNFAFASWRLNSMPLTENLNNYNMEKANIIKHSSSKEVGDLPQKNVNEELIMRKNSCPIAGQFTDNFSEKAFAMNNLLNLQNNNFMYSNRNILRFTNPIQMNYYPTQYEQIKTSFYERRKPKQFARREGDWICNSCKNLNFAFRINCNRCHLPKAESEKMQEKEGENKVENQKK